MDTCKQLIESLYMDNSTSNQDEEDSAVETYHKDRKITKVGGFELIDWVSNCPALISRILTEDLAETEMGPAGDISKPQKMLVIPYIPREDVFSLHEYHKLSTNIVDTKMWLTS